MACHTRGRRPREPCRVTTVARHSDVRSRQREIGNVMIEPAGHPAGSRVTGCALRGESGRQMVRIRRRLIVGLMARVTVSSGTGVSRRVATVARDRCVSTCKREVS